MKTTDIYENINCLKIFNKIDMTINNVSIDTRKIKENDLYIGIKGEKHDGNDLFMEAFLKGASIAVLEKVDDDQNLIQYLKDNNKSIILVNDTVLALGELAKFKRASFKNPVVAITGSAGKTSTKDMVYSVLNEKFRAHKTIGNQNNHIGLPLTILALDENTEVLVLEMGMNHLKEISYLTSIAKPDVAIITNVGTAHIGNLGNRENILKAKLEILEGLSANGKLIINNDNDLLHEWYLKNKDLYNVVTIGIKNKSDYVAKDIKELEVSSEFRWNEEKISVPIGGEHFIYNSLVALAVGEIFDIDLKMIKDGIANFELTRNRMTMIKNEDTNITVIDDSYNANFDSLRYGIKYLSNLRGRRIAVIGTMLELGEYSSKLHQEIGDIIYEEGIDILITVGEFTDLINKRAIELGMDEENAFHFKKNLDAINKINEIKTAGDKILVKASMSMHFKEIVDGIV